jgi:hypothetical protein
MSDLMNLTALGRVVGREAATLQTWCRHGMPHVVRGRPGGGRLYVATIEDCREWMEQMGVRKPARHEDGRAKGEKTRLDELHRAAVHGEWPRDVCGVSDEVRPDRAFRVSH